MDEFCSLSTIVIVNDLNKFKQDLIASHHKLYGDLLEHPKYNFPLYEQLTGKLLQKDGTIFTHNLALVLHMVKAFYSVKEKPTKAVTNSDVKILFQHLGIYISNTCLAVGFDATSYQVEKCYPDSHFYWNININDKAERFSFENILKFERIIYAEICKYCPNKNEWDYFNCEHLVWQENNQLLTFDIDYEGLWNSHFRP